MRTFSSLACNIAWFNLADFVARGQKERALYMYKLLMHSIEDKAISFQLEGDILAAFSDEGAISKYLSAINIYKNSGKFQQAISLCLQAQTLKKDHQIKAALYTIYFLMNHEHKALEAFSLFTKFCFYNNKQDYFYTFFDQFLIESETMDHLLSLRFAITAQSVIELLIHEKQNIKILCYLETTMQTFEKAVYTKNNINIQKFLSELAVLDESTYQKAKTMLSTTDQT